MLVALAADEAGIVPYERFTTDRYRPDLAALGFTLLLYGPEHERPIGVRGDGAVREPYTLVFPDGREQRVTPAGWLSFKDLLEDWGIPLERTKLYRHTTHGVFGDEACRKWDEGPDVFLSFATYQTERGNPYSEAYPFCAHFLAEKDEAHGLTARFLGVTEAMGATVPFNEDAPVQGYIPGEADKPEPGVVRVATPLRWVRKEAWRAQSEGLVVNWGSGGRAKAPRALTREAEIIQFGLEEMPPSELSDLAPAEFLEEKTARYHLSIERRTNASRLVRRHKEPICEGCGLHPVSTLGAEAASVLEVHHLQAFSELDVGTVRKVHPVRDFALLCANCHRLIHGLGTPSDLAGLRARLPNGWSRH